MHGAENEEGFETEQSPAAGERVADRPHPIAIRLALIGPALAAVAVGLSFFSYLTALKSVRTSEMSMEVGQRAYIFVHKAKSQLFRNFGQGRVNSKNALLVRVNFEATNSGNTPAELLWVRLRPRLSKGWSQPDTGLDRLFSVDRTTGDVVVNHDESLAQNTSTKFDLLFHMYLDDEAASVFSEKRNIPVEDIVVMDDPFTVTGEIVYRDVFQKCQSVQWCWEIHEKMDEPIKCSRKNTYSRPERNSCFAIK